jgi:hypothetical protein
MAFQPVPDTAEFRLIQRFNDATGAVEVLNTIYVRNTVLGWPAARLSAVATTIGNGWRDQILPQQVDQMAFLRVEARDLGVEFGATATVVYELNGPILTDEASTVLAVLASLNSTEGGAPKQGRLFITGFAEADISQNSWTAARIAAVKAGLEAIDASISGGGDAWVIVSRKSKSVNPVPPHLRPTGITNEVTSILTRGKVATQRDRRPGE